MTFENKELARLKQERRKQAALVSAKNCWPKLLDTFRENYYYRAK